MHYIKNNEKFFSYKLKNLNFLSKLQNFHFIIEIRNNAYRKY